MKIGQRLTQIDKMIINQQDQIWDCCCDHGLLGMTLLKRKVADCVHFVDLVGSLTFQVEQKLQTYFYEEWEQNQCSVQCLDVRQLTFNANHHHLIIIAGVGGDKVIEFLLAIADNNSLDNLEFIVCPVHHNYKVRQCLQHLKLGLINEALVKENNRFYEVLHVSLNTITPISLVGDQMWDFKNPDHLTYLAKTRAHFRKKAKAMPDNFLSILSAYDDLHQKASTR